MRAADGVASLFFVAVVRFSHEPSVLYCFAACPRFTILAMRLLVVDKTYLEHAVVIIIPRWFSE